MTDLKPPATLIFPAVLQEGVAAATKSTLGTILGSEPTLLKNDDSIPHGTMVIGLISFIGDQNWSAAYILPEKSAVEITRKFVGFDIAFDSPDMADVVGELVNVIAGDITAVLDRKKIKAQMSLPNVSRGENVEMLVPSGMPTFQLAFHTTLGRFWCRLICAPNRVPTRRPGT